MPDRRVDTETRSRVVALERRQHRSLTGMFVAIVILYVAAGWAVWSNHRLVERVQDSRVRNVHDNCINQNERHDRTVATIDRVLVNALAQRNAHNRRLVELAHRADAERDVDRLHRIYQQAIRVAGPTRSALIVRSRAQNVLLIDALAPVRDCKKLSEAIVE